MDEQQLNLIVELMEQVTSLSVISKFLKSKELHHSAGSWDELRELRLLPALRDGHITLGELVTLLGTAEEYGRSHTFLYQQRPGLDRARLFAPERIRGIAAELGCADVIDATRVLDQPAAPTISAIRWEQRPRGRCLTIIMIEKRERRKFLGEDIDSNANVVTWKWEIFAARAVNVVRFYDTGLLEVSIQSHTNSSDYEGDLNRFGARVYERFFPLNEFDPFSLHMAKKALWDQRANAPTHVKFSDSLLRNDVGTVIRAATRSETGDLFEDEGATASLAEFLGRGGGYCDEHNIWWVKGTDDAPPSKDVHVLLSGKPYEFAVTSNCTREDHEYVLDQLLILSR